MSVMFLTIIGRVIQLRYAPPPEIAAYVPTRGGPSELTARRGQILDRRGRRLGVSHVGYRLYVDPQLIDDPMNFARELAQTIGDDPVRIDQLIGSRADRRYVVITHLLTDQQLEAVRELRSRAIGLEPRLVRSYPKNEIAGQVLGFVGFEHSGLDGLEFALDRDLAGEPGEIRLIRDSGRRPVWIDPDYEPASDGPDIVLSLDVMVQRFVEEELAAICEKYQAKRAEAIVLHAGSGQILAMANWPFYDPSRGGNESQELRRNRCVTDAFEPGSIFKPVIWSAALASGDVTLQEKIDCTTSGVYRTSFGRRLRDVSANGTLTWEGVLMKSSNIGMAKVGLRMGSTRMYEAVRAFGFGLPTGSGLPGEAGGIVNPLQKWTRYSETSIPMGQEIAVTPLQIARAFTVFANDGWLVTPAIRADETADPILARVIDEQTALLTRQAMRKAVLEGTGRRAQSEVYQIWGKTGTAQVADHVNGGYREGAYTASFVGGAPLDHPEIIIAVIVHEPDPEIGYYGGVIAAPTAKKIIERTLIYLGTEPDGSGLSPDRRRRLAHLGD